VTCKVAPVLNKHYAMKTYSGCTDPSILDSVLDGGEWSASRPGRSTPDTHWIGRWVGTRAGLDDAERRKILPVPGFWGREKQATLTVPWNE
jgi:hypothetical protein